MAGERSLNVVVTASMDKMRAELAKADAILATTSSAMRKMSDAYDGSRTIANANAAMLQIQKLGGVTGLTDKEQKRLNAELAEGIAKYSALGRTAPASMVALEAATRRATVPTATLGDRVGALTGRFQTFIGTAGIGMGIAALTSFATRTMGAAGDIADMAAKLDISTEATQRYSYAAKLTGADMDGVGRSVIKLSTNLAGGDASVLAALKAAGVSFEAIRAMNPEQAFDKATAAIQKIPDPMTQARIALDLFGKSGVDLLPAIRQGFTDLANEAPVMRDSTVQALDAAGDALDRLSSKATTQLRTSAGVFAMAVEEISKGSQGIKNWWKALVESGGQDEAFIRSLERIRASQSILTLEQIASMDAMVKQGKSAKEIAAAFGPEYTARIMQYVGALGRVGPVLDTELSPAQKRAASEAQRLAEAIQKQADIYSGADLERRITETAAAVSKLSVAQMENAIRYEGLGRKLDEFKAKGGQLPDVLHKAWLRHEALNPSIKVTTSAYEGLIAMMKLVPNVPLSAPPGRIPITDIETSITTALAVVKGHTLTEAPKIAEGFNSAFVVGLANLPSVIFSALQSGESAMRAAFASVGGTLGDFFSKKFSESATKGMSANMTAMVGGVYSAVAAVVVQMIPQIIEGMRGVERALSTTEERLKALQERFVSLGATGREVSAALQAAIAAAFGGSGGAIPRGDMEGLIGIFEEFKTTLELEKIAAQWKAAYDAMLSSGQYTAATLAEVWQRYKDAMSAAAGKVAPDWGGFPTREELEQSASDAEALYTRMRESGLFTAKTLEQAYDRWQDAMIASGNEGVAAIRKIDDEMKSLRENADFMAEQAAPEYENGVRVYDEEEKRVMARLAELEKEKAAALASIAEQATAKELAAEAADRSAQDAYARAIRSGQELDTYLRDLFAKGYKIPIAFSGGSVPGAQYAGAFASGGVVEANRPTYALFGEAGPERATFTPMGRRGSGGGGGVTININNPTVRKDSDIREITRQVASELVRYTDLIGVSG